MRSLPEPGSDHIRTTERILSRPPQDVMSPTIRSESHTTDEHTVHLLAVSGS